MNSSAQAAEFEELRVMAQDAKTTIYATVASMALLLFDYSLTFSQEVDLVWRRQFTWGKVLFFITRYFGLASHIFNTGVYLNNTAGTDLSVFNAVRYWKFKRHFMDSGMHTCVASLVIIRSLTSRSLVLGNPVPLYGSISAVTTMCVKALFHHAILSRPGPFLSGCYGDIPSYFYNVLIAPAITTSVLLGLTAYKTLQTLNYTGHQKPPMIQLLLRDGILYFVAVFGVLLVNIVVFHVARNTLSTFATGFFVAIPCMVGSRMFLNVREKLLHPNPTTEQSLSTFEMRRYVLSDIDEMDFDSGLPSHVTSPQATGSEPNSATTLVAKHTPWTETHKVGGDLKMMT